MNFVPKEELPGRCPPDEAVELSGIFVRLIAVPELDEKFCCSFNALGEVPKRKVDPCIWAGCSLILYDEEWADGPLARVRDFALSVRLLKHKPFGAILEIPPGSGLGHRGSEESPHFTFWMADTFDPKSAVKDIVSIL